MEPTEQYTPALLQPFRNKGDEATDKVVGEILKKENMGALNDLFRSLATNSGLPNNSFNGFNPAIRADVKAYFDSTGKLPDWAQTQKFDLATDVFTKYGPEILMILISYSLPFCYSCANGAKVLHQTGRLEEHNGSLKSITRRLVETAQFVINMLTPKALTDSDGKGLVSVQKVRLIHAVIRTHLEHKNTLFVEAPGYNIKEMGVPINQEDLTGTMLSFSVIILRGLHKMGVDLPQEQKEAFVHYWNVVGSMLGVPDELIPPDLKRAEALTDAIFNHQAAPSKEGKLLTQACIDFMEQHDGGGQFKHVPLALVHFFCGERIAKILQVEELDGKMEEVSKNFFRDYLKVQEEIVNSELFKQIGGLFGRELVELFLQFLNEGKKVRFHLPASLQDFGRPLRMRKRLPTGDQLKSVDQAVIHLQEVVDYFKAENNPNGLFAALYLLITRRVGEGIKNNEFEAPEVMEAVDLAFVSRYFEAINTYLSDDKATPPWMVALQSEKDKGLFVDQYIFVATNAHMGYDLSLAVAEVCQGDNIHAFKNDFEKMNAVFDDFYDQLNTDIADIWWPFALLMKFSGNFIRKAEHSVIAMDRDKAWDWATKLSSADDSSRHSILGELTEHAEKTGKSIVAPTRLWDRLLRTFARMERGSVADKIDIMLRTSLVKHANRRGV